MRMKFMNPVTEDEREEILSLITDLKDEDTASQTIETVIDWLHVLITPIVYTENGG